MFQAKSSDVKVMMELFIENPRPASYVGLAAAVIPLTLPVNIIPYEWTPAQGRMVAALLAARVAFLDNEGDGVAPVDAAVQSLAVRELREAHGFLEMTELVGAATP